MALRRLLESPNGIALLLLLVALALKLGFLFSVKSNPFVVFPVSDEAHFLQTARTILKSGLLQEDAFYFEPLYPSLMAGFFALFGEDVFLFKAFQAVCGASNAVVVFYLGRAAFNSTGTGMIAAGLTLLYGPFYLYDVLLWKSTFAQLAFNGSLLALFIAVKRSGCLLFGFGGVLMGLPALLRGNTLIVIPFVCLALLWLTISLRVPKWTVPAWLFGVAIAIGPVTLHNAVAAHDFVLTTYQGGTNFYIGNHRGANGTYVPLRPEGQVPELEKADAVGIAEKTLGKKLKPSEVSNFWLRRGLGFIVRQPLEWAKLMLRKTKLLHGNTELPDTIDFTAFRDMTPQLWTAFLPFSAILGLSGAGFFLSLNRWRDHVLLYAVTAGLVSSVILFFVVSRYRFPVVSVYILFAAFALSQAGILVKKREFRTIGALLLSAGVLSVFSYTASVPPKPGVTYNSLGYIYLKEMVDYDNAAELFRKAVQEGPREPTYRVNLANALELQGRYGEAAEELWMALGLLRQRKPFQKDETLNGRIAALEQHHRVLEKKARRGGN